MKSAGKSRESTCAAACGRNAGAVVKSFDGGRRAAVTPGKEVAAIVEAGLESVAGGGAIKIVADVVFAGPDDLHGRAGFAGDESGFDGVVLNEAAAEASADEGDVDFDAIARNAESLGDGIGGGTRELAWGPRVRIRRRGRERCSSWAPWWRGRGKEVRRRLRFSWRRLAWAFSKSPSFRMTGPGWEAS